MSPTCPPRHGYYGTSGPPAQVKAVNDLKVYHANPQAGPPQPSSDVVVIHPGAVLAILDLLPSVSSDSQPEVRPSHSVLSEEILEGTLVRDPCSQCIQTK